MGEILLDWEGHDKTMSNKLLEFFKEEYLVDFSVTCHGQQKKVHKFVLAILFPMLKESLRSTDTFSLQEEPTRNEKVGASMLPTPQCLNLDNIANHPEDIEYLIQYAYTGKTIVSEEHAECLMQIADSMEIESLKESLGQWHDKRKLNDNGTPACRLRPRTQLRKGKHNVESVSMGCSDSILDKESSSESIECFYNGSDHHDDDEIISVARIKNAKQNKTTRKRKVKVNHTKKKSLQIQDSTTPQKITKIESTIQDPSQEPTTTSTGDKVTEKKILQCSQCDYAAAFRSQMERHLRSHTRNQGKAPKHFSCETCKKRFESRTSLEIHSDSKCGSQPLVCKYCGHKAPRRLMLQRHMITKHHVDEEGNPLEKNIKCPDCDFVCYGIHQLKVHSKEKHERLNKFKCKDCNYTASYSYYVLRHERKTHQNVRNYMCEECGYRFQTSERLNQHILARHKGLKLYKCGVCGKEYSNSLSFKVHIQRHEGKVEYKFVCHVCGHNLRRKFELRDHMRKKHGMELDDNRAKLVNLDPCHGSEVTSKPTS